MSSCANGGTSQGVHAGRSRQAVPSKESFGPTPREIPDRRCLVTRSNPVVARLTKAP